MKRSVEYFDTQAQAQEEGEHCRGLMYGYGYRFTVYQQGDVWALDASWYTSCD